MKLRYFAWLRERLNRAEEDLTLGPQVRTVADVIDQLCADDEAAEMVFADRTIIRAALDDELVDLDTPISGASTLTLFPPMTGADMAVRLQAEPFDPGAETNRFLAETAGAGAAVSFTGLVRVAPGDDLTAMTLEHWPEMAQRQLERLEQDAIARFDLLRTEIIHRYGRLTPGEPIVQVMTLSAHRQAAFDGANFLMDTLKTDAPFWKKEERRSGAEWVAAKGTDDAARDKWR